jgi:hypothetical protein
MRQVRLKTTTNAVKRLSTRKAPPGENPAGPAAEAQLASFIKRFEPGIAKLIRDCRSELRRMLPAANELVYDNYNFFVIGYCSTERASDCIVSIAAAANGVGLSFYWGATLPDPTKILQGSGKQNRFIRIPSLKVLRLPEVGRLVEAAAAQGKAPLVPNAKGHLVIKSVSLKQKPRRSTHHAS